MQADASAVDRVLERVKAGREVVGVRRAAALPPFRFLALLRLESPREEAAAALGREAAAVLRDWLTAHAPDVSCLGPVPAPMERRQNRYHMQLMLSGSRRSQLHAACARLTAWLEASPEARRVRWSLDVDPQTLG